MRTIKDFQACRRRLVFAFCGLIFASSLPTRAAVAVLTSHNDNARTGQNTNETILTLANVKTNTFGLLFTRAVDDAVYAQPLVMTNVNIPGKGAHNVVIVATVDNSIYAFDADDSSATSAYWQTNFLGPNIVPPKNTDMTGACGGNYQDFHGNMGIIGTPVIDPASGTLFVVVRTKENGTTYVQRLCALDVATGIERSNSPVVITATYNAGSLITFDPQKQNQRPGLALVNGIVYIGWASHCDWGPYHGWLIGYSVTNMQRVAVYNATPSGNNAGIWQGGVAPAADASGNIYFETGNGTFNTNSPNNISNNFGDTVLKLSSSNGLVVADYFTPWNQSSLDGADNDLGSGAAMLLPDEAGSLAHPHLMVAAGKEGKIYLLDRDNMGHFRATDDSQIVQVITNAVLNGPFGGPAYFNNTIYYLGRDDVLKAYRITNAFIPTNPISQSASAFGFPGATPSISANGTNNAIVWALQNNAWAGLGSAILHAYNATNLATELYNSSQAGNRDLPSGAVKFTVPVIANGKVYVGGQSALAVFGNGTFINTPTISPNGATFTTSVVVTLADTTSGASIYYTRDGTTPTTNSTLYVGPFILTNTTVIQAKAFKAGSVDSQLASATFYNSLSTGLSAGLTGSYWSNQLKTFNGSPTLTRIDPTVNFDWGGSSPDPRISSDSFTVRWTGDVRPQFTQTYTFYTVTDDGVRLYVNNQLLIDKWVDQGATEWSGSIALTAGYRYPIRMEFYDNAGAAVAKLSWSSPSTPKAIIPQSQLYPTNDVPPTVSLMAPTNGTPYKADEASVQISAAADDSDGTVRRVDFYAGTTLIATLTNTPYTFTWTKVTPGSYALTAQATDDGGITATSAAVNIIVTANSGAPYGLTNRSPLPPFLNMPPLSSGSMPGLLSQTGAFTNAAALSVTAGLVPYNVNVPLWSDGAIKTRWFALPNDGAPITTNEQIGFSTNGEWSFPAGTIFVKHFELATNDTDLNLRRRLETRLLVRDTSGSVYGVTYKWRADNSDADLLPGSLSEDIVITTASGTRTQTWYYPSPADCLACHTPVSGYVLGVKPRQLNGNFTYPASGQMDNQLRTLNQLGLFNPPIANETNISTYPKLVSLTDPLASLEDRSRSYIDANCAQCHRPGGASHANFDARYDTPLTNQNIVGAAVVTDLGIDNARVVMPQDIWRSLLYQRANRTDPAIKMPPLARNLVDSNAVTVLAAWINSLPGTPALAPPSIVPNGGSYTGSVSVALQHSDPSAILRYTIDSSSPDSNSTIYTSPLILSNSLTLKAKAFETGYNESIAASALFNLQPPVFFLSGGYFSNGQFDLLLSGEQGKTYVFQATTNFSNWIDLTTNTAPSNLFYLTDPGATGFPYRFYRAVELP